jgi:hypothetical protein
MATGQRQQAQRAAAPPVSKVEDNTLDEHRAHGQALCNQHGHDRPLEERHDGPRMAVLGQPGLHEADRTRQIETKQRRSSLDSCAVQRITEVICFSVSHLGSFATQGVGRCACDDVSRLGGVHYPCRRVSPGRKSVHKGVHRHKPRR